MEFKQGPIASNNRSYYVLSTIEFNEAVNKCPILSYLFKKLNKTDVAISTIVLAYYTLFQSYRTTNQWNSGRKYIEQFQQVCAGVDLNFIEDYDPTITNLLLVTGYFSLGFHDEAIKIIKQLPTTITDLVDELASMCRIIYLLSLTNLERVVEHGVTLELPYALSECGEANEKIHVKPER
ncbi:unnamed protein product, partial [Didymodactylos carnosus]